MSASSVPVLPSIKAKRPGYRHWRGRSPRPRGRRRCARAGGHGEDPDHAPHEREHEVGAGVQHEAGQDGRLSEPAKASRALNSTVSRTPPSGTEARRASLEGEVGNVWCREPATTRPRRAGAGPPAGSCRGGEGSGAGDLLGCRDAHIGVQRRPQEGHQQEHPEDGPGAQRQRRLEVRISTVASRKSTVATGRNQRCCSRCNSRRSAPGSQTLGGGRCRRSADSWRRVRSGKRMSTD